jgi:hypothetical protein
MTARLALASVAAVKTGGHDQDHETIVLSPSYGQLNYYSPVLFGLARFYRDPLCQHLAQWDATAGAIQQSRYITDNGAWMLFSWGGYAYAWYDPTLAAATPTSAPLSFWFPSINEAYLRSSYEPGGIVAGMRRRAVVIHAGGRPVYVDLDNPHQLPAEVREVALVDEGPLARLSCVGAPDSGFAHQTLTLQRPGTITMTRATTDRQSGWCHGQPTRNGNALHWNDGTTLTVTQGRLVGWDPQGYHDEKVVGMGRLRLRDPLPMAYALITAEPENGQLGITVHAGRAMD